MRVLLVTNPSSGSADARRRDAILSELARLGHADAVEPGDADALARELPRDARGAELVVVAGGDGTFNCTVNALADARDDVVFGLLPMGTGNDFARTMGLPMDALDAARALVEGRERAVDLARASGPRAERLFVNACMGGFPVQVDESTSARLKKALGPGAFWAAGAKEALTNLRRAVVTMNGVEVPECVAAGVGNGRTCGGGVEVWPRADPGDGALDGCALAAPTVVAGAELALKVRNGDHESLEGVATTRAARVELDAEPSFDVNVDGELVGLTTPATFEVAGSLRLRVPGGPVATGS